MKKKMIFFFLLVIGAFLASVMVGKTFLSFDVLLDILKGTASSSQVLTLMSFRLPRACLALLAGLAFGFSGFALQGVTRNELADASILGINNGAGLFVIIYLGFYAQGSYLLPLIGTIGGLAAACLVYFIAFKYRQLLSMERVLLAGIAVNAGLAAGTLLLTVQLSKDRYSFVTSWLSGAIWGTSWAQIISLLPWVILFSAAVFFTAPLLNLLGFGEEQAISLGVSLTKLRTWFLLLAVGLAASTVGYTGNLAFVGLLAPHIAKGIVGKESRTALVLSGMVGSILVLVSDTIGRLVLTNGEIPAGIIISLVGAPYFLYLMIRQKAR
ncbi:iron complex transport system permease [Enterococcus sp. DIV0876]